MKYIIGTRGSRLALAQADYVCARLQATYPDIEFEIKVIQTKGDLVLEKPLHEIGDKGVFVKEIERELLEKRADIGVHSMKDMPSKPAAGLLFTKAWNREDPRDVLILREKQSLSELHAGAVIGTGSKRREFQLKKLRPDLKVVNIRGNVDTRIRKMHEEKLDGIVLAAAGLHRLGMQDRIACYLEAEEMISAPAQGVLALEIREGEEGLLQMLDALGDDETANAVEAERGFLQEIGGDCHVPIGAVCKKGRDGVFSLRAMFGDEMGKRQAYVSVSGSRPCELAKRAAAGIRRQMAGMVVLVGAGPGDPGLITVKGLQAIREADCIVYDRLASPELLAEAKPGCEKIYVGKESHHHTMPQEEINRLLVQKSMQYKKTVRLKGGDAYVFGRGGEECLFLKECGVPFEVIPGITSSVAGLAYAGIPVTHRGKSLGFHVVTAHDRNDELAKIDFEAMAKGTETCVFLMGLSKVGEIAERLMDAGMSPRMGAAVISCATMPSQKTCASDLMHISEEARRAGLVSPALIVVGEVVSLRDELNFFERRPLFGKKYLIPRIGEQPTRLRALLLAQGADVDEIQVGQIVEMQSYFVHEILDADWLVFTSKNGVESFWKGFMGSGQDLRSLAGVKIAAIGGKTAQSLQRCGLRADLTPDEFHSGALADELKERLTGSEKVVYLRAQNAGHHLQKEWENVCRFVEIAVYENQPVKPDLVSLRPIEEYDGVLFTCASSAKRLLDALGDAGEKAKAVYSIGPKTTAYLEKRGVKEVRQAGRATYEGLADEVVTRVSELYNVKTYET